MARILDRLKAKPEPEVDGLRCIYRDKPEVADLVRRVAQSKGSVPLTMAEWDLWVKYVQVLT